MDRWLLAHLPRDYNPPHLRLEFSSIPQEQLLLRGHLPACHLPQWWWAGRLGSLWPWALETPPGATPGAGGESGVGGPRLWGKALVSAACCCQGPSGGASGVGPRMGGSEARGGGTRSTTQRVALGVRPSACRVWGSSAGPKRCLGKLCKKETLGGSSGCRDKRRWRTPSRDELAGKLSRTESPAGRRIWRREQNLWGRGVWGDLSTREDSQG